MAAEQTVRLDGSAVIPVSGTMSITPSPLPVSGSVSVANLPATQPVSGNVAVTNLPVTQPVSGSVAVTNFPATQPVTVSNFPATQAVTGSMTVSNFPATQPVSGTVAVSNFPATQAVTGTVTVNDSIPIAADIVRGSLLATGTLYTVPANRTFRGSVSLSSCVAVAGVSQPSIAVPAGIIHQLTVNGLALTSVANSDTLSDVYIAGGASGVVVTFTQGASGTSAGHISGRLL